MDRILVINSLVAGGATLAGLYSHKLTVALAAWFWLAAVHLGLVLLAMGQAGVFTAPALPVFDGQFALLTGLIATGIQTVQVSFANVALLAYFVATVGILLLLTFAAFLVSSVLTGLARLLLPQKASA